MKIVSYKFGEIIIDEKKYENDLIIFKGKIIEKWWRKEGHYLTKNDIDRYVGKNWLKLVDTVIIGNGADGLMRVDSLLVELVQRNKIDLLIENSNIACKKFNDMKEKEKILFLIHLTC